MSSSCPAPASAALRADPAGLVATAIADFQADLAAADGPRYNPMAPDRRLGALVLRLVVRLAEAHGALAEDYGMGHETTALDDFVEDLEAASTAVLGPAAP